MTEHSCAYAAGEAGLIHRLLVILGVAAVTTLFALIRE